MAMSTFAIGEVNGDYNNLLQLLADIGFDKRQDQLWFSGNMVNSGSDSLAVLRFVKQLGNQACCVLGEQELRLLAIAEGIVSASAEDSFDQILAAPDRAELLKWLRNLPFLKHELGYTLVNAGIPVEWSLSQALTLAMEAEVSLSMGNHKTYLENLFVDGPTRWHAKHRGWKRVRFITHAFTRLRYYDENGRIELDCHTALADQKRALTPWYLMENRAMADQNIIFGCWPYSEQQSVPGIYPLTRQNNGIAALKITSHPTFCHT